MLALRYWILISAGLRQVPTFASAYHVFNASSASGNFPQNLRNVLLATTLIYSMPVPNNMAIGKFPFWEFYSND
jgi:hypothetical protein